jgi:hypothetical protein
MGLATLAYEQARPFFIGDASMTQLDIVEWLVTAAWQWLALASVVIWLGTLLAECQLLVFCRGEQRAEMLAILRFARQRQRRQTWLWLSAVLVGTLALFWLRLAHALPHQRLNALPDWPALASFLVTTVEGWLWLARGALVLLGFALLTTLSILVWRRERVEQRAGLLAGRKRSTPLPEEGAALPGGGHSESRPLPSSLAAEMRIIHASIVVSAVLLLTLVLADSGMWEGQFPIGGLALAFVALLALAVWLGRITYTAFVLIPACRAIENDERTQALLELFQAIRPAFAQVLVALLLYGIFFVEARITNMQVHSFDSLLPLLHSPTGWAVLAEVCLLGGILLLASYQARRVLPHLARMAWLAARGTLATALSGMDVSRSLEISQDKRQELAALAERRLLKTLAAQTVLSLLLLLCLVLAALFAWQIVV